MNNVQRQPTSETAFDTDEDAADAILDRWTDAEELSEDTDLEATAEATEETEEAPVDIEEEEENDEDSEDPNEDPDEDDQETETEDDDDDDAPEEVTLSDESLIEVAVDGETKQASLKDLKRLYGQEASLTRKSQEVASKRKEADDALKRTDLSYQKLLERAEARNKPYADVDMLVASKSMSTEDFSSLRREAKEAETDLRFLKEEANAFYQETQTQFKTQQAEAAKECIKTLQDTVEGWGNDLYNDIRTYAVSVGLPKEQVDQYVDPNVIILLNKARMFDKSMDTVKTKKAKVMKVKTSKGKVLRSVKAPKSSLDANTRKRELTAKRVRENSSAAGDLDDIADALLARWEA